jgi:hypothetical protein
MAAVGGVVRLEMQGDSGGKVKIWEVVVLVIVRGKVSMNMYVILNGYGDRAV